MSKRIFSLIIGTLGAAGVGLGAFGAHALKAYLTVNNHLETWHTAVLYHLLHTVAALALFLYVDSTNHANRSRLHIATLWCWLCGVALFSGSLYALSLGAPHWFGPITPIGGLALIAGWCCFIIQGIKTQKPTS